MEIIQSYKQWEAAAPCWAKWEKTVANWVRPATDGMLEMVGVVEGARIFDRPVGWAPKQ